MISGDLNARVGNIANENVKGKFGEGTMDGNGEVLREIATLNELKAINTFFRKRIFKNILGLREVIDLS